MILVTGAAGKTGRAVIRALRKAGTPTRALVRAAQSEIEADEVVVGDLLDGAALSKAMDGVSAIYLICPNVHPDEFKMAKAVIAEAQAAKVSRLVYHSVLFPQIEAMPHHWQKFRAEEALIESGLDFTILQPASYMQNILAYWNDIRGKGEFRVPYSVNQKFSPVDLDDVAAVASKVLLAPGHTTGIYPLAGPELLSSKQMAAEISRTLGKKVEAKTQSLDDWQAIARKNGMNAYALDALSKMFTYYDQHSFVGNSQTLKHLLNRPPTRFSEFLQQMEK